MPNELKKANSSAETQGRHKTGPQERKKEQIGDADGGWKKRNTSVSIQVNCYFSLALKGN